MSIADWPAADAVLGAIRTTDNRRAEIVARRDEKLRRIQEQYAVRLDALAAGRAAWLAELEQFCQDHRADFGRGKSRKLDHGRVGWRIAKPKLVLHKVKSWAVALAKVLAAGKRFVHWVRQQPVLVKEAVAEDIKSGSVTAAEGRSLGLRLDAGGEIFFATPATDQPRDRTEE